MLKRKSHSNQLALELSPGDDLESYVEARVAARAEADALRWRFRLVVIESVMIASLVLAAGVVLDQPIGLVLRGAGVVGAGCFVTGLILIGLTGAAGRLLARFRRPR
ncbi:hypothetical protein KFK14_07425 [Sphingobium phenoxybenzoativorans]|uniref:Uncharacterized protein n=3 Tax=Sphingomonadaceae TaxID=41297 RepID=A0A975Q446_9SPHN|nr:hypothetical protein [Sphingobium phenoxybenzoativorans]QUT08158.1 hypothetical protein KFK14_07425 [Sphingobium phenoxybenzoativorans]BAV63219.1 hypothetical protein SCLO_1001790 [Sphingobium cloacae]